MISQRQKENSSLSITHGMRFLSARMSHLRQRVTILAHRFAVIETRRGEENSNLVYDDRVRWNSCYSLGRDRLIIIVANNNSARLEFIDDIIVVKAKYVIRRDVSIKHKKIFKDTDFSKFQMEN